MAATKRKWIQNAVRKMRRRGTLGSYGHHSRKQMLRDIRKGGRIAKKAQFALNVSKRKSTRSKKRVAARRRRRVSHR